MFLDVETLAIFKMEGPLAEVEVVNSIHERIISGAL